MSKEFSPTTPENQEDTTRITRRRFAIGAAGLAGGIISAPGDFSLGSVWSAMSSTESATKSAPTPRAGSHGYPDNGEHENTLDATPVSQEQ